MCATAIVSADIATTVTRADGGAVGHGRMTQPRVTAIRTDRCIPIDLVILTHEHPEHVTGLSDNFAAANQFPILPVGVTTVLDTNQVLDRDVILPVQYSCLL